MDAPPRTGRVEWPAGSPTGPAVFLATFLVFLFTLPDAGGQAGLPEIPEDRNFTQDYAGVIAHDTKERLGERQREAFRQHDTPIIVVTIGSKADYGFGNRSIEEMAYEWFNHWEIGKREEDGELINQGILVLVSVGDRRARIELGADWGRRWDRHCSRIMDNVMVPEFANGDYNAGVRGGVEALADMAAKGPDASPPQGLEQLIERLEESPFDTTPLPLWATGLMVLTGTGMIVMYWTGHPRDWFMSEKAGWLLIGGILLIVGAFFFWILVGLFALFNRGGGSGGFSSGGGFGTGGFSGGGGASGSW